jgi:diketogulonate reductase-like aldo/keto reductase
VCAETVHAAIALGYRHLDCACDYGNEVEVGMGIARAINEGLVTREELWKFNDPGQFCEAAFNTFCPIFD